MIQGYCIIECDSRNETSELVMNLVKEGWIPCGGVAVTNIENTNGEIDSWYAQAMIKNDEALSA